LYELKGKCHLQQCANIVCSKDFTFGHGLSEGGFASVINGWVVSFMEGAAMVRLGARKKVLE